jgi:hypothetical protein
MQNPIPTLLTLASMTYARPQTDDRILRLSVYIGIIHTLEFNLSGKDASKPLKLVHPLDRGVSVPSWLHLRDDVLYATTRNQLMTSRDVSLHTA